MDHYEETESDDKQQLLPEEDDHTGASINKADFPENDNDVTTKSPSSKCVPVLNWLKCITVEPPLVLIIISFATMLNIRGQYMRQEIGVQLGINNTAGGYHPTCIKPGSNSTLIGNGSTIDVEIQKELSNMNMYLSATEAFCAFFSVAILGALSDRVGRKRIMLIPIIGYTLACLLYTLIIVYELPLSLLVLGSVIQGLSGGITLIIAMSFSYITDITPKDKIMFKIVVIETIFFLGAGVSQIGVGYFLEAYGYVATMLTAEIGCVLTFIYVIAPCVMPESIQMSSLKSSDETVTDELKSMDQQAGVLKKVYMMIKDNTDNRRLLWVIGIFSLTVVNIITSSIMSLELTYGMGEPFCWGPVFIGYFTAVDLLCIGIGGLLGAKLLPYCLPDIYILYVCLVDGILSVAVICLAPSTLWLLLSCPVGFLRGLYVPVMRAMASSWVGKHEQGTLFACIGSLGAIGSFVSPILFNSVYSATVGTYPTFVFNFIIALFAIPLILTFLIHIFMRNRNTSNNNAPGDVVPINAEDDE